MKIAIVSPAYPLRGGIAEFAGAMATNLVGRGHEVKMVSFSRQYPSLLFPGKTQYEDEQHQSSTIESETFKSEALIDSINPISWLRAADTIVDFGADLVIFNYWMPFFAPCLGTISRRVKKKSAAIILFVCHNVIPHEKRPGDTALTTFALGTADHCLVLSSPVGDDLRHLLPEMNFTIVPHPVYDTYGDARPREVARSTLGIVDENVILFFGFIRKYKGLDLLIQAMPAILERLPVRLLVVGEFYDDESGYRKMVDDLELEACIEFRPEFVPRSEVGTYFSAADLVVLPYRSATQSGIVQIAYHFNTPCVVTDVGGLSEMVEDGEAGFVVPPGNVEALATAVVRFFEETDRQSMQASIQARKGGYSWDALSEAIESIATI